MNKQAGKKPTQSKPDNKRPDGPLGNNEQQYRRIVDTAYEGIWVLSEEYFTTFVNKRMADMLGYKREEMVGKSHAAFFFDEDLPDLEEKKARRRQGIAEHYERRLRRKDGTTLWTHVSTTPILDREGRFRGSFAMFTDVTERKEVEDALSKSELKYRGIFENAVEGIFQSTPDGRLITLNPAMAKIFGYESPEDMIAGVSNIGHQLYTDSKDRRTFIWLLETDGIVNGFEAQFYRKDNTLLWGSLSVRAVKDESGEILCYEGTLEDITARKTAEEELRKSEEKYRNIFENAMEGIFQVTPEGRYLSVNPALARIHGFNAPGEMFGSVTDIADQLYVDPSRRAELSRLMEEQGFVKNFEIMMRRKDMGLHWVSVNSRTIRDKNGSTLYYEGTLEDITSRKIAEEELMQLRKIVRGIIQTISSIIEIKDPGTAGHQKRVSDLAAAIAQEIDLAKDISENIRIAGTIHDIGKLAVPTEILSKPARVTEPEYILIKTHPQAGYDMLKNADLPYPILEIIIQHHERLNGSGYPWGLKGSEILLESRILAVADVVEAMVSNRPHRAALGIDAALEELSKNQGVLYDTIAVKACIKLFKEKGYSFPS